MEVLKFSPEKKLFQIKSSEESKVKMTVIQVKRCIIEMVNLYKQAEVWIFNDRNDYSNVTLVLEDDQVQALNFLFFGLQHILKMIFFKKCFDVPTMGANIKIKF